MVFLLIVFIQATTHTHTNTHRRSNMVNTFLFAIRNIIPFERQKKKWDKNNSYKTTFTRASTYVCINKCIKNTPMYIGSNVLSKVYD